MPFPSVLSAPDHEQVRNGIYNAERYAIVFNGSVMMQFSPDSNASGKSNATIEYSTVDSGGTGNVIINMTVIISPTSDYIGDLQDTPDSVLITYVRQSPTASLFYIGETAFQWTTSNVVTVLSEWRVHEKRTIISGSTIFKNVSIERQNPRPRIFDLFDDIVVTSAPNVNYSPTPNATAMTSGATIVSWSWDVIENGVVSKNASSSQNPTFDLDIGKHWLILTVTDDGGLTHTLAVKVAIVPRNFDSIVENTLVDAIEFDMNSGARAGIDKFDDASLIVPGAPCLIIAHIDYTNGITENYVELAGWLGGEVALELSGDEQWGQLKTYADSVLSIRNFAETIRLAAFPIREKASPAVWGEMTRGGIYDAIWYITSEHSTLANVASQEYPSDFADYRFPNLNTPGGTIPDVIDALSFRASGDMVNYSPNGEMIFAKSLFYETTDATRDSAPIYGSFTIDDSENIGVQRNAPGLFGLSIVLAGFATFNTTTSSPRIYHSQAPAGFVPSVLLEELDGIIMAKDLSDTDAKAQAGKFTANHFFAATDTIEVSGDFISAYRLYPRGDTWVKLTLAATDTLDGSMFDNNTRFIVTRLSSSLDVELGKLVNNVTLRKETTGGDNYANETAFVPIGTVQTIPTFPVQTGYPDLADFEDLSDYYGDDYDDYRDGWEDVGLPPENAASEGIPDAQAIDTIFVPLKGGVINSNFTSDGGKSYLIRVSGDGIIGTDAFEKVFDFTLTDGGFTSEFNACRGGNLGVHTPGTGWEASFLAGAAGCSADAKAVNLSLTIVSATITRIEITYDMDFVDIDGLGTGNEFVAAGGAPEPVPHIDATDNILNWTGSQVATIISASLFPTFGVGLGDVGSATLKRMRLFGVGGAFAGTPRRGDAFYDNYNNDAAVAYTGQGGLNLDGSGIVHGQDYDSSHVYEFTVSGTGSIFAWSFFDNDNNYSENENTSLKVEIFEL